MQPRYRRRSLNRRRGSLIGRPIVNPVVDYLFVGGAITIPIFIATYFFPS